MTLNLTFPSDEINTDYLSKYKSRTMIQRLENAEEIFAVCGDIKFQIRQIEGVYVRWGLPVFVFKRIGR